VARPEADSRTREWAKRYIPAEVLGTLGALVAAWIAYDHTHSYITGAASGWVGEGIGFYGYFVSVELLVNARTYRAHSVLRRLSLVIGVASTNLLVEFVPAEVLDNFLIRPAAMFVVPQHVHPYALGFLVGKFGADAVFYLFAILGYEARKRWLRHPAGSESR